MSRLFWLFMISFSISTFANNNYSYDVTKSYNFTGYGINFTPQKFHNANEINKMIQILDGSGFKLIQLMGDYHDINSKAAETDDAALFNAIYNTKNIQTVSFVIYTPYDKFGQIYKNGSLDWNLNSVQIANNIDHWLTAHPDNNVANKSIQEICQVKKCEFIIGNELFWIPLIKEKNSSWQLNRSALWAHHMQNMLSIGYYINQFKVELDNLNIKNYKIGINTTLGTQTQEAKQNNAISLATGKIGAINMNFRAFNLQSISSTQSRQVPTYAVSINPEDSSVFPYISEACKSQALTVEGLINSQVLSGNSGQESHQTNWQNGVYSTYNQQALGFSKNESLCEYFKSLLNTDIPSNSINIVAPHLYPFWLQGDTVSFTNMLPAVYHAYVGALKSLKINENDAGNTFQVVEMGYASYPLHYQYAYTNQPAISRSDGKPSEESFVDEVLNDFNNDTYLQMVGGQKENAIFFEAFDSSIDYAGSEGLSASSSCMNPNDNFGLFNSVVPIDQSKYHLCVGQSGYKVEIDNASYPSQISYGKGLLEFKKAEDGSVVYRYASATIPNSTKWMPIIGKLSSNQIKTVDNFINEQKNSNNVDVTKLFADLNSAINILDELVNSSSAKFLKPDDKGNLLNQYPGQLKFS